MQKNITLKKLYLSYNKFGDGSGQAFKDALSNNDTLHLLDLSWNLFRTQGALCLSDGMKVSLVCIGTLEDGVLVRKFSNFGPSIS